MNRQKPTENINELTREFLKKGGLSSQRQGFETLWCLTDEKGREMVREINLRPGLKMVVVDCQPDEGLAMDMEIQDSPLEFNFFVSGMTQSTVIQSRSKKENFVVGKGQTCMGLLWKIMLCHSTYREGTFTRPQHFDASPVAYSLGRR
jgi:hypothetical protein